MAARKRCCVSRHPTHAEAPGSSTASALPVELMEKWLLPHLDVHELAEYACLGGPYPELTLDARIMATDRSWFADRSRTLASPRTLRLADECLRRVYPDCFLRERRIMGYIEAGAKSRSACFRLMLSKWEGPLVSAAVLARIEAALDSSRSLDEASFLGAEADIVESYALLLEKRAFFDNPGGEEASVLRRCACDTRFASGDILVDALLKFGFRMGDPENAVREACLTGWDADVSGLPLAVAWLERVKQGQMTAAAWRDSGCALVDLVDCMLAAVRVSIDVLHGSDEELYTAYEEGLLHARA